MRRHEVLELHRVPPPLGGDLARGRPGLGEIAQLRVPGAEEEDVHGHRAHTL